MEFSVLLPNRIKRFEFKLTFTGGGLSAVIFLATLKGVG